jgi:hypothetical protein
LVLAADNFSSAWKSFQTEHRHLAFGTRHHWHDPTVTPRTQVAVTESALRVAHHWATAAAAATCPGPARRVGAGPPDPGRPAAPRVAI